MPVNVTVFSDVWYKIAEQFISTFSLEVTGRLWLTELSQSDFRPKKNHEPRLVKKLCHWTYRKWHAFSWKSSWSSRRTAWISGNRDNGCWDDQKWYIKVRTRSIMRNAIDRLRNRRIATIHELVVGKLVLLPIRRTSVLSRARPIIQFLTGFKFWNPKWTNTLDFEIFC